MYSHEIEELLKAKNYLINIQEYLKIIQSPQINHIYVKDDTFYLETDDRYKFTLKIERNKKWHSK